MLRRSHHSGAIPNVRPVSTVYDGKPGKVAVIAVANKLVRQAFAVVTHGKPYVDGFKSEKP